MGIGGLLCLAWLCACASRPSPPPVGDPAGAEPRTGTTVLHFARLIDGTGEVLPGHEIAVAGGRILAVGEALHDRFPDAGYVDLGRLTALPGLIDAHVHITYGLGGPSRGDAWTQLLRDTPPAVRLESAKEHARLMLQLGITSARDLFALDGVDFELRGLIEQGEIEGPRLFLSGTGIHPLVMPELTDPEARLEAVIMRVNEVAGSGAEWLKVFATTGSASDLSAERVYTDEEIAVATKTAHARGLKVAVHTYGSSAVPAAIRAGVDSIEHAVGVDDRLLEAWAEAGIAYVPTIDHNRYYADHADEYGYGADTREALHAFVRRNLDMLRRAHAAGIPIVFGSDAVMTMFGENTRELEWFVQAGLTPAEVIRAATVNGALLLGQQHALARLAPGYAADIIAVDGNPLEDIRALTRRVRWVMKAGKPVCSPCGPQQGSP